MSVVYLAEQIVPVQRRVALKILSTTVDSAFLARFEVERQTLAWLDDERVARLLDSGMTEDGRPFLVLEYVPGIPITEYCDSERLTVRQRVDLVLEVCEAVRHAHQRGILHRDIKPHNVLVARGEGSARVKVIDFGLAKLIGTASASVAPFQTEFGEILGTPEYMAPEQACGNGLALDVRADVYSLGVVLFELLAGSLPVPSVRLRGREWAEIRTALHEDQRPLISVAAAECPRTVLERRGLADAKALRRVVRGSLDAIVQKAIDPLTRVRYSSVEAFAGDLRCWLEARQPQATRGNVWQAGRLFVKRQWRLLAVVCIVSLAIASTMQVILQAERRDAERLGGLRQAAETSLVRAEALRGQVDNATPPESPLWQPLNENMQAAVTSARESGDAALLERCTALVDDVRSAAARATADRELAASKQELFETLEAALVKWLPNTFLLNQESRDEVSAVLERSPVLQAGRLSGKVREDRTFLASLTPVAHLLLVDARIWLRGMLRAKAALEQEGLMGHVSRHAVEHDLASTHELCARLAQLVEGLDTDPALRSVHERLVEALAAPDQELHVPDPAEGCMLARCAAIVVEMRTAKPNGLLDQLERNDTDREHAYLFSLTRLHETPIKPFSWAVQYLLSTRPGLARAIWFRIHWHDAKSAATVMPFLQGKSRSTGVEALASALAGDRRRASRVLGESSLRQMGAVELYYLALAYQALGRDRDAQEALRLGTETAPLNPRAWCNLGWLRIRSKDLDGGVAARRLGHTIGISQEGWIYDSHLWVEEAERFAADRGRLQGWVDSAASDVQVEDLRSAFQFAEATNQVDSGLRLWTALHATEPLSIDRTETMRTALLAAGLAARAGSFPELGTMPAREARMAACSIITELLEVLTAAKLRDANDRRVARIAFQLSDRPDIALAFGRSSWLPPEEEVRWKQLWDKILLLSTK